MHDQAGSFHIHSSTTASDTPPPRPVSRFFVETILVSLDPCDRGDGRKDVRQQENQLCLNLHLLGGRMRGESGRFVEVCAAVPSVGVTSGRGLPL